jgi:DNA polymerase-3 subunit delta'
MSQATNTPPGEQTTSSEAGELVGETSTVTETVGATAGGEAEAAAMRPQAGAEPAASPGGEAAGSASLPSVFAGLIGQERLGAALGRLARRGPQVTLLVGREEHGAIDAALRFAAALLCPEGGCGRCRHCRLALARGHPDLHVVERTGATLSVEEARDVVAVAWRSPFMAPRRVIVVLDLHHATAAVPILLKTLEEPPAATAFVLHADSLGPALATVASRAALVEVRPVPSETIASWLEARGMPTPVAEAVARAADGSPRRASVLAEEPDLLDRRRLWSEVPSMLDGTGNVVAKLTGELMAALDASLEALRRRHHREAEELEEVLAVGGEGERAARRRLEERHHREERRWRMEELRAGLAAMAGAYRARVVDARSPQDQARAVAAVRRIEAAAAVLVRNPNERLLLEALLVRLGEP